MPLFLSTLLGEALSSCGAAVHYSLEADNDDTLAAFAQVIHRHHDPASA